MKKLIILLTLCLSFHFLKAQWSTNSPHIYYNAGNVGIGTSSPTQPLDVRGQIYTTGSVVVDGGDLVLKRTSYAYGYVVRPNVTGYKKLQFAVEGGGPLEELYVNSDQSIFSGLVHAGDSYDPYPYGCVQLVRPASPADNKLHLSFVRGGNMVVGMGYVPNSNTFGIWHWSTAGTPLMSFTTDGTIGIGTTAPGPYKLAIEGTLGARKIKVTQANPWADYVFEGGYKLPSLQELEKFIREHKHLPEVPSATEVEKNGLDLGDNQALLLKKIEELTLYIIQQQKEIEALKSENKRIDELNKEIDIIKRSLKSN